MKNKSNKNILMLRKISISALTFLFMILLLSPISISKFSDNRVVYANTPTVTGADVGMTPAVTGANVRTTPTVTGSAPTQPQRSSSFFNNPIKAKNLNELLVDFLKVITTLGAIVVVFFFILAGFKYVTARGDEGKVSDATRMFTWTTVGAAVILGAQVIARVIENTVRQLQ
jgi:hypothetical protein